MATLFSKALCLFTFESYGTAVKGLEQVKALAGLEVLEVAHRGSFSTLLFLCSPDALWGLPALILELAPTEELILENPHPELVKTYLNLVNHRIDEALLIFECQSFKSNLESLQMLLQKNWQSMEFKFSRSGAAQGYLMMTGKINSLEPAFLAHMSTLGNVQCLENPAEITRKYFNN